MKRLHAFLIFSLLATALVLCFELGAAAESFHVLVFSKTTMFRHASITNGISAIKKLGATHGFAVDATEDASTFRPEKLKTYKAIVFLSTSGDILDSSQQEAFKNYIESGGGLAAIHAAVAGDVATEGNWPWYGEALCARFTNHSSVVDGTIQIEDTNHVSTRGLPKNWLHKDEWYNFISSPRPVAHILASLDESSYKGGTMGKDHPIAWTRNVAKGRVWYTALGHTEASFEEPLFLKHLLGGIYFASGAADSKP
jgi:cytochrome c